MSEHLPEEPKQQPDFGAGRIRVSAGVGALMGYLIDQLPIDAHAKALILVTAVPAGSVVAGSVWPRLRATVDEIERRVLAQILRSRVERIIRQHLRDSNISEQWRRDLQQALERAQRSELETMLRDIEALDRR